MISEQIERLETAKVNIKAAIEDKGVTVSETALLNEYPQYIEQIEQGAEPVNYPVQTGTYRISFSQGDYRENFPDFIDFSTISGDYYSHLLSSSQIDGTVLANVFDRINWNKVTKTYYWLSSTTIRNTTASSPITLNMDTSHVKDFRYLFYGSTTATAHINIPCISFKAIGNTTLPNTSSSLLYNAFNNKYMYFDKMEDIGFNCTGASTSYNFLTYRWLSDATCAAHNIPALVDGLVDYSGGATHNLKIASTAYNLLTDEQKSIIAAKNWVITA